MAAVGAQVVTMSSRAWVLLVAFLFLAAAGAITPQVTAADGDGGTNDTASEDGDGGDRSSSEGNATDPGTNRSTDAQQEEDATSPNGSEGLSTSGTADLEQPATVSSEGRESLPAFIGVSIFGILGAVGLVLWNRYVT